MSETFFTSDLHLGHHNIIGFCNRPWGNVDDMHRELIDNWNETVSEGDTVYVLGDVALGDRAETLPIMKQMHGTKILVPGNHDRCWGGYRQNVASKIGWMRFYHTVFDSIIEAEQGYGIPIQVGDHDCVMSHFPYTADHQERAHLDPWRPRDEGDWLICGHVHTSFIVQDRQVNVGTDVWDFRPVAESTLSELISSWDRFRAENGSPSTG